MLKIAQRTAGQLKLKSARVVIVGLGGLGSPAALYLAAAGVGTLGLIDDEIVVCKRLQQALTNDGHLVETFVDSRSALERIKEKRFDVVVTDIKMPDMDGLELARRIRERAPDMRLLMVSGYFYRDDVSIQEAISQGLIIDFISKPFLQAEILRVLAT